MKIRAHEWSFLDILQLYLPDKLKAELLGNYIDIKSEVDKKMDKIEKRLREIFDSGSLSLLEVLCVLSDGKPMQWSEILREVGASKPALSRRLRDLSKKGIVKRNIVPAFPPKTIYQINKDLLTPEYREMLEAWAKLLYQVDFSCRNIISLWVTIAEIIKEKRINIEQIKERLSDMLSFLKIMILNCLLDEITEPSDIKAEFPVEIKLRRVLDTYAFTKILLAISKGIGISEDIREVSVEFVKSIRDKELKKTKLIEFEKEAFYPET
ncbi:helix-turn-helix transcriptional regulator [Candidatus Bathyarchaeota archaeon]|nr:helix-turn-helix transcriptional regulator [Candidatus Bathyarchaeota archaeon]